MTIPPFGIMGITWLAAGVAIPPLRIVDIVGCWWLPAGWAAAGMAIPPLGMVGPLGIMGMKGAEVTPGLMVGPVGITGMPDGMTGMPLAATFITGMPEGMTGIPFAPTCIIGIPPYDIPVGIMGGTAPTAVSKGIVEGMVMGISTPTGLGGNGCDGWL
jgi:hypothetical protein